MGEENVDITIYLNALIKDLTEEGFFDKKINPLMDEDVFRKYGLKYCNLNMQEFGDPMLDLLQFDKVIFETKQDLVNQTVTSLYEKELLDVVSVDESGGVLYGPSQKAIALFSNNI